MLIEQAKGENLRARLEQLGKSVVLPKELVLAATELRLLGNDAAHVESKDYEAVGQEEVELAVEFAREILKGVYQVPRTPSSDSRP